MGDKRTRIAGSNIALSSQTALYTIEDVKQESELSALDEIKSAKRKSDLYMNRAQSYYQDAQLNAYNVKKNYRNSLLNSFYKF